MWGAPPTTPPTIAPVSVLFFAPVGAAVDDTTVPGAITVVTCTKVVYWWPSEVILWKLNEISRLRSYGKNKAKERGEQGRSVMTVDDNRYRCQSTVMSKGKRCEMNEVGCKPSREGQVRACHSCIARPRTVTPTATTLVSPSRSRRPQE
jgi:hypothetical protein